MKIPLRLRRSDRLIVYQDGARVGTPKGTRGSCTEVEDSAILPSGYVQVARQTADRRIVLAGYRLADLLKRLLLVEGHLPCCQMENI
jgi:hypothetical protein